MVNLIYVNYSGTKTWNSIDNNLKSSNKFRFKSLLKESLLDSYMDNYYRLGYFFSSLRSCCVCLSHPNSQLVLNLQCFPVHVIYNVM